ncbi:DUF3455 domain-containing protein [Pseudomonas sp. RP23018S]|uniref:DUF3455 domain-containing protein n=1 Tax=Pseudomonas sp. RP23018S TaxID=3096037 RepID=UPI002ACA2B2B|nr:DUF3455 domain-containing protein [Pseudomonas sp. RP23018S]MDZ5602730.1 DUF3455 domain-containing protein [Pseudomonas sp. RP23018S]
MTFKPASTLLACGLMLGLSLQVAHAGMATPDAIKVPEGNAIVLKTTGVGEITYECRDKANAPGQTEWFFVGPKAELKDRSGSVVGEYFGPPATWKGKDGSSVTGTQLAIAPAGKGDIPYQLVKANPADGEGKMKGVTYIQRLATQGGVAPSSTCSTQNKGEQQVVKYQADYIFWAAK